LSQQNKVSYEVYFREGCILLSEQDYENALIHFENAYKIDSINANINYQIGYCFLNSLTKKAYAERYFAKAVQDINSNYIQDETHEKGAPPLALLYYGRSLHVNYKFKEALIHYTLFKSIYAKHHSLQQVVNYYEKQTLYAIEKTTVPLSLSLEKIVDSTSKEYESYKSVINMDDKTIIYAMTKTMSINAQDLSTNPNSETVFVSYKDLNGKWISDKTTQQLLKKPYSTVNQTQQTNIQLKALSEKDGNLYYNMWNGSTWGSLQEFGSDINTDSWEGQGYLNPAGTTLYFVSERAGGYGGRDIYRCVKLPNGKWSKAFNLGPTINTEFDEGGPFVHPDGRTFVFNSQGHQTMGGFDIFFSIIDDDKTFYPAENMGFPINTTDDDVFFVSSADGKSIYFSSLKNNELEKKDVYKMIVSTPHDEPLALCKGLLTSEKEGDLPNNIVIIVRNRDDGKMVGTYKPKKNGTYITLLTPNKHYIFSYQLNGEEFCRENIFISTAHNYQITKQEIDLETITVFESKKMEGFEK
jgi:hypothetical protein